MFVKGVSSSQVCLSDTHFIVNMADMQDKLFGAKANTLGKEETN
jgi:hypothetical protein